jgi:hypothetical protein
MGGIMMPYLSTLGDVGQGAVPPADIPNLSLWYNPDVNTAAKVNLNGSNEVTQIIDLSNAGHPANSFGAKYPDYITNILNGLNGVRYTSANQDNLDINPIAWAQSQGGFTLYVVARPTTIPGTQFPLVVTDANLGIQWSGSAWQVGAAGGVATAAGATNNTATAHIYGMIFDGSATGDANRLRFRYDGAQQTLTFSASPGTQTSASASTMYFCGNNRNNPKSYMDGYLFEVMIWLRALNSSEIAGTEAYIKGHWGI